MEPWLELPGTGNYAVHFTAATLRFLCWRLSVLYRIGYSPTLLLLRTDYMPWYTCPPVSPEWAGLLMRAFEQPHTKPINVAF